MEYRKPSYGADVHRKILMRRYDGIITCFADSEKHETDSLIIISLEKVEDSMKVKSYLLFLTAISYSRKSHLSSARKWNKPQECQQAYDCR